MTIDPASPLERLLAALASDTSSTLWLWQVGIALLAAFLGWAVARVSLGHIRTSPRWKFGKGDFERVAGPLLALVFVALGKLVLGRHAPTPVLAIAESLLEALLAIRLAVYVLGLILPEGAILRNAVRLVAWIAWIGVALYVTGLLPDAIAALEDVGFNLGKQRISLWLVLQAVAALALTLAVALWVGRITESRVLAAATVEMSTRIVVAKLVRASSVLVAILVALPMVGIDLTTLSVFTGALGVGLGFGLQKIASNYVSGFIVLLDRSLRIGDVVTVEGRRGEVKAIASRYTVLRGLDGVESIIPNETLITQTVAHHTYTDPRVLVILDVGVAYDTDIDKACELLAGIARAHRRVLQEPGPAARIKELADFSINLQLLVWIGDPEQGEGQLKGELLREIVLAFRAHGIEIPFPRRDVHLLPTVETREKGPTSET